MWCDLGFFPNSRGNKASANLRPRDSDVWPGWPRHAVRVGCQLEPYLTAECVYMLVAPFWCDSDLGCRRCSRIIPESNRRLTASKSMSWLDIPMHPPGSNCSVLAPRPSLRARAEFESQPPVRFGLPARRRARCQYLLNCQSRRRASPGRAEHAGG